MNSDSQKTKTQPGRIIFLCGLAFIYLGGFLLAFLPAQITIGLLNHLSPDGNIERLTISLVHKLQPISLGLSIGLLLVFLLFLFKKALFTQGTTWITHQWQSFLTDSRQTLSVIWKHMHNRQLWLDVLFIFAIALILRFMGLNRPLEHDEAFTYYVFGRLPLRYAIADYAFPNNHIFHTILLKVSVAVFGNSSWAMRFPAYLFGAAAAPLLTLFARYTTHKRNTSLLAGGFAALYPFMIYYSSNARGYTMLAAFTILGALLVDDMMKHKNRFLWLCFSIVIIVGLWTMPIMLLPAGGLYIWVLWLGLTHQHDPAYGKWGWMKYAIASGILIILGTLLVYTPVFLYSGIGSIVANPNVAPLTASEFLPTLSDRLKDTWQAWQGELPLYISLPAVAIMLLAFFHPDKKVRKSAGVIPALLAFLVLYSIVQKPNLWPRVTFYLVPFLMLAFAYGLATLWQIIHHDWKSKPFVFGAILALALISLLNMPNYSPLGNSIIGETEQQTQWLAQHWQEDQLILIAYPEDMAFSVYAERYGIPPGAIRWEQPFRGAYVIINKPEKQTVQSVIQEHGPELFFFDLEKTELISDFPNSTLYYLPSHRDLVENAYQ